MTTADITDAMMDAYVLSVKRYVQEGNTWTIARKKAGETHPWVSTAATDPDVRQRLSVAYKRNGVVKSKTSNSAKLINNAGELTRWLFYRWRTEKGDVSVGDVYEFCPQFWLDLYEAMTGHRYKVAASFTNEFMPSQQKDSVLFSEGWQFEPLNGNGAKKSAFRIVQVPLPPAPPVAEVNGTAHSVTAKEFSRDEAEKLAEIAAAKAVAEFLRNFQGRLPL